VTQFADALNAEQQGLGHDNRTWTYSGGYLLNSDEPPRDHHWLVVGPELSLFDPSWGHQPFGYPEPPDLARYLVGNTTFPEWKREALVRGFGALPG
jgi:hypothetical protein